MNDKVITIERNVDGLLILTPASTMPGRQGDHLSAELVFERPPEYSEANLNIYLNGGQVCLGQNSRYSLPNSITCQKDVMLSAEFVVGGEVIEQTNMVPLTFGGTQRSDKPVSEPIPQEMDVLQESAWFGQKVDMGSYYSVRNTHGQEVERLPKGGGGSGTSTAAAVMTGLCANYDWFGHDQSGAETVTITYPNSTDIRFSKAAPANNNGPAVYIDPRTITDDLYINFYFESSDSAALSLFITSPFVAVNVQAYPGRRNSLRIPYSVIKPLQIYSKIRLSLWSNKAVESATLKGVTIAQHRYRHDVESALSDISQDVMDLAFATSARQYMVFGDSIVSDWIAPVMSTLSARYSNLSVSGAFLADRPGTVLDGNPVLNGPDANVSNTVCNQVQKVLNAASGASPYPIPDAIIIAAGVNDTVTPPAEIEGLYTSGTGYVDVDTLNRENNMAASIRWQVEKLLGMYPNARIYYCTPVQCAQSLRSASLMQAKCACIMASARRTGCFTIDLWQNSGIYGRYERYNGGSATDGRCLRDGVHPNAQGAAMLTKAVLDGIAANRA